MPKHNLLDATHAAYLLPLQQNIQRQQEAELRDATNEKEANRASNRIAETQKAIGKLEAVIRKAERRQTDG